MKEKLYNLMNWARIEGIVYSEEDRPGEFLGPKQVKNSILFQAFFPDARKVTVIFKETGKRAAMELADEEGFFAALITGKKIESYFYEVETKDGRKVVRKDPYAFPVVINEKELERYHAGIQYHIYRILGSHETVMNECRGVQFGVWVPGAVRVSVVGKFNDWDGRRMPMNRVGNSSVFTLFVPDLDDTTEYQYEIKVKNGSVSVLNDPYADRKVSGEKEVSCVHRQEESFLWEEDTWTKQRKEIHKDIKIFSWDGNGLQNSEELVKQVQEQGFDYVSLPANCFGESFYQSLGCFNCEKDVKDFVNKMHKAGIGVVWNQNVEACQDLYRKQVSNFYISNILYMIEEFHIDGLIFSAMEKLLYLDYGKAPGQWTANIYGGNENLDGVEFIKHTNSILKERDHDFLLIADMDAIWPKVTAPFNEGGLGFDYRYDTAFAKNLSEYVTTEPTHRKFIHDKIISRMEYAYEERFLLAFDWEKVSALWNQIPGKEGEKFSTIKAMSAYAGFLPGKMLSGLEVPVKKQKQYAAMVKKCNDLNSKEKALGEKDYEASDFRWLNCFQEKEGTVSFLRDGGEEEVLLVVANFLAEGKKEFNIGVPYEGKYELIFDSEEQKYGGKRKNTHEVLFTEEIGWDGYERKIEVDLLPLSVSVYRYRMFTEEEIYALAEKRIESIREKIMAEARQKAEVLKKSKGKK